MRPAVVVQVCGVLQLCLLQPTLPADLPCGAPGLKALWPTQSIRTSCFAVPAVASTSSSIALMGGGAGTPARCKVRTALGIAPQGTGRAALTPRAVGSMGPGEGEERQHVVGYPPKTLAAVRSELVQRRLECPFPFGEHARGDVFEALLERLLLEGLWPDKYDKMDRNKANKQARLEAAMWAVQHSERLSLSRDQIQSMAKAEGSSENDARRVAADLHNLRLTLVEVMPRTTDSVAMEWSVNAVTYEPLPLEVPAESSEDDSEREVDASRRREPVEVCLVYSASKYWSTARLASMQASSLDDDWMPKSFSPPPPTPLPPSAPLRQAAGARDARALDSEAASASLEGEREVAAGETESEELEAASGDTSWPPQATTSWPPRAPRIMKPVDELHKRDNITAIGRSKGAGTTWKLSKDVERAFNPELAVEERRKQAEGRLAETRRIRNFTGWGVLEETLLEAEADWHREIDQLDASVQKYQEGGMSGVDFVRAYRAHFRRQWRVPAAIQRQTLGRVQGMLKRDFDIDFKGVPLNGYTGVDKFYDKSYYHMIKAIQVHADAQIEIDSDVYRAIRAATDSPVLNGAFMNPPEMYQALERHIDKFVDLYSRGEHNPVWDHEVDMERLLRVKHWLRSPPETRRILEDLIRPGTPGSVLQPVDEALTEEEEREVDRAMAKFPTPPGNMTHVEAAIKLEFPTKQSRIDWQNSKPSWYHTDDVVVEYGVMKRMSKDQLSRYVYDQTVRDWDFHMEFTRAALRCGLEGQDLVDRLSLLPPRWVPELADGRPIPVLSWRPPAWQEFLDPSLIQWLDEHDAMSSAPNKNTSGSYASPLSLPAPLDTAVYDDDAELAPLDSLVLDLDNENSFESLESSSSSVDASLSQDPQPDVGGWEGKGGEVEEGTTKRRGAQSGAPPRADVVGGVEARGQLGQLQVRGGRRSTRGSTRSSPSPASRMLRRGGPPLCVKRDAADDVSVEPPDWKAVWEATDSPPPIPTRPSVGRGGPSSEATRRTSVPDWLTNSEAREAIGQGRAWLERHATGWHLLASESQMPQALVAGLDYDEVGLAVEDGRLLGDDEAWRYLHGAKSQRPPRGSRNRKNWHETLVLREWKSLRLEARGNAATAQRDLLLHDEEFWLEPDDYDRALLEEEEANAEDDDAATSSQLNIEKDNLEPDSEESRPARSPYTADEARKRNSYFKTLNEWMEAKRGRVTQESEALRKVLVNCSLTADEDDAVVRDLRDGVFGKSLYCSDIKVWVLDDRDAGRPSHSSDLAGLCTVAEAYGWGEEEELKRQASLRTYSLHDYQSFRVEPKLTSDETSRLVQALKEAGVRFAYAPDNEHRPGLLLLRQSFCPAGREVLDRVLPTHTVHEGEYQALIPMDELPTSIHNRLCDMDYGEVQYWQAALPVPQLPPLGHLLREEDQHAWLVPQKFTSWLREDLMEHGWRTVDQASEVMNHDKVLVTGEWVSMRLLAGKPAKDVHERLVSGKFGKVVRLGDVMPRPTALDYDLSMLMKDVYMIPKECEEEVLKWLEPDATRVAAEEEELQRQVDQFKAGAAPREATLQSQLKQNQPGPAPRDQKSNGFWRPDQEEAQGEGKEGAEAKMNEGEQTQDLQTTLDGDVDNHAAAEDEAAAALAAQEAFEALREQTRARQEGQSVQRWAEQQQAKEMIEHDIGQIDSEPEMRTSARSGSTVEESTEEEPESELSAALPQTGARVNMASKAVGGLGALRYAVEKLHPSWYAVLEDEFQRDYFVGISKYLRADVKLLGHSVYPTPDLIFNAFDLTPFDKVKVVILGQDPYHGAGQAHGLAFSVPPGVRAPPSLQNIFKELSDDPDVDFKAPVEKGGDLSPWAAQGVLLLNTVLTVREGDPLSHRDFGWETFTDTAIQRLNERRNNVIFVLWGANAQKKAPLITGETHTVLMASHPSPLSANKGRTPFIGSRHFSQINEVLREQGDSEIDWRLS